jgi:GT2 family glycosyltransferase
MSAGGRGSSGELWPAVTVIVPVLNGARTIVGTLDSIATQDYPRSRVETIVVENGSTDGSRDLVARHVLPVRLLVASCRGSAAARNVGIRHASHDLLAFTDADCRPDPGWLRELVRGGGGGRIDVLVGGPILAYQPTSTVERFAETLFDQESAIHRSRPPYAITANMLGRKAALLRLGLFDETFLRGQDVDLSYRAYFADFQFRFAGRAVVRHVNPRTLGELYRKGLQHGDSLAALLHKHGPRIGVTPLGRILDRRRYGEIGRHAVAALRRAPPSLRNPTGDDRARLVESVCEVVFRAGKQAGLLRNTLARVMAGGPPVPDRAATRVNPAGL